ncbi:MAG: Gfo/Idh/MocA family oxidoreductase [Kiritimatiellae bacterium]|nr:Gfo/Idh/MocA family oxidoreductase [Kiritimatiellia bacterium]
MAEAAIKSVLKFVAAAAVAGMSAGCIRFFEEEGSGAVVVLLDGSDRAREKAAALMAADGLDARSFEVSYYTDGARLLDCAEGRHVVAAVAAVPPGKRGPFAIEAVRRGMKVLSEAPLAGTLKELGDLESAAKESKVEVRSGSPGGRSAVFAANLDLLESGALGRITEVVVCAKGSVLEDGPRLLALPFAALKPGHIMEIRRGESLELVYRGLKIVWRAAGDGEEERTVFIGSRRRSEVRCSGAPEGAEDAFRISETVLAAEVALKVCEPGESIKWFHSRRQFDRADANRLVKPRAGGSGGGGETGMAEGETS